MHDQWLCGDQVVRISNGDPIRTGWRVRDVEFFTDDSCGAENQIEFKHIEVGQIVRLRSDKSGRSVAAITKTTTTTTSSTADGESGETSTTTSLTSDKDEDTSKLTYTLDDVSVPVSADEIEIISPFGAYRGGDSMWAPLESAMPPGFVLSDNLDYLNTWFSLVCLLSGDDDAVHDLSTLGVDISTLIDTTCKLDVLDASNVPRTPFGYADYNKTVTGLSQDNGATWVSVSVSDGACLTSDGQQISDFCTSATPCTHVKRQRCYVMVKPKTHTSPGAAYPFNTENFQGRTVNTKAHDAKIETFVHITDGSTIENGRIRLGTKGRIAPNGISLTLDGHGADSVKVEIDGQHYLYTEWWSPKDSAAVELFNDAYVEYDISANNLKHFGCNIGSVRVVHDPHHAPENLFFSLDIGNDFGVGEKFEKYFGYLR